MQAAVTGGLLGALVTVEFHQLCSTQLVTVQVAFVVVVAFSDGFSSRSVPLG